jgi:predicted acyltransferase
MNTHILKLKRIQYTAVPDKEFYKKLMRRVVILFLLGLILNINSDIIRDRYRIMGVLQRISLCYLVVALQVIYLPRIFQYAFNFVYIAIYLGLLLGIDVPGCGRGSLDADCNAAKYIDEQIFTENHMFPYPSCQSVCGVFDPEGILGTFTACLNVFAGVLYGQIMDVHKDKRRLMKYWSVIGCAFLLTGVVVNIGMPINKNLWSISFSFITCASSGTFRSPSRPYQ